MKAEIRQHDTVPSQERQTQTPFHCHDGTIRGYEKLPSIGNILALQNENTVEVKLHCNLITVICSNSFWPVSALCCRVLLVSMLWSAKHEN